VSSTSPFAPFEGGEGGCLTDLKIKLASNQAHRGKPATIPMNINILNSQPYHFIHQLKIIPTEKV
jgi:hypothetical protein